MKRFGAMILAVLMLTAIFATGYAEEELVFGNITFSKQDVWNNTTVAAFQYAAEQAGVKTVIIENDGNMEKQINGMETLINEGVDAISVYTMTPELDVQLSDMAKEAGIPVSFENGLPGEGAEYVTVASYDWELLGAETCQMLADVMPGKKVLLVLGAPGMNIVEPWSVGFDNMYEELGQPFEIVDRENTDWGTEQALNVTQDFIQSGKEFDAIFAHNGQMYAGCMAALKDADMMDIVKTCGGGSDDELEWLKAGELDATISYLPSAQGIAVFKSLWMHAHGQEVPKRFDLPMVVITKDNVDTAARWEDYPAAFEMMGGLD